MTDNRKIILDSWQLSQAQEGVHAQAIIERKNKLLIELSKHLEEVEAERDAWKDTAEALSGGKLKSVGYIYPEFLEKYFPNDVPIVVDDNVPDSEAWIVSHDRKQFGKITGIGCSEDESDGE